MFARTASSSSFSSPHPRRTGTGGFRSIVIDALNVMKGASHGRAALQPLLAIANWALDRHYDLFIIADACARHYLGDDQGSDAKRIFENLCREQAYCFNQAPARTEADVFILLEAEARSADIVTNDAYEVHAGRFPWVDGDGWRVPFMINCNRILIEGSRLTIEPDLTTAVSQFTRRMRPYH